VGKYFSMTFGKFGELGGSSYFRGVSAVVSAPQFAVFRGPGFVGSVLLQDLTENAKYVL